MPRNNLLPLVVGVTGHRDLRDQDCQALKARVQGIFDQLRKLYPTTPLLLLSALAEGADRLVASVALKSGIRLIAPLPLPREEYERDFATAASKAEFAELLERSDRYFTVPPVDGESLSDVRADARAQRYLVAGAYIAQHSIILIALWDGVTSNLIGGTSHIVRLIREGASAPRDIADDPSDLGSAVYHIDTPRVSNSQLDGKAFTLHKYFPQSQNLDDLSGLAHAWLLKQIEASNCAATERGRKSKPTNINRDMAAERDRSAPPEFISLFDRYVRRTRSLCDSGSSAKA